MTFFGAVATLSGHTTAATYYPRCSSSMLVLYKHKNAARRIPGFGLKASGRASRFFAPINLPRISRTRVTAPMTWNVLGQQYMQQDVPLPSHPGGSVQRRITNVAHLSAAV